MARVLIVDDTDIVRKALELALKKMGHDAESTSDAHRAIELARARPVGYVKKPFHLDDLSRIVKEALAA
jgi:DNA-binding NtrC family response regulator